MLLGVEPLGDLALGDAPFAQPFVPVFPQTAGDLIVVDSTAGGFGSTDVTRQVFQSSNVAINDPDRLFNEGAIFAFMAGFDMAHAPNPLLKLIFTKPDGSTFIAQTPDCYVGDQDLATYQGRFLGGFYCIYAFQPKALVRGQWSVYLSFQPTPQDIPLLSGTGVFQV